MFKLGIVGLGRASRFHLATLEKDSRFSISAVCDVDEDAVQKAAEKYGARAFSDFYRLIGECENLDAVVVTLPNDLHYPVAKTALETGKHVVVEKPMTIEIPHAEEIIRLSRERSLVLYNIFHRRFNKNIEDFIANPSCQGRITSLKMHYDENAIDHSDPNWILNQKKSGGGCVMVNGINCFDAALHLVREIKIREAEMQTKRGIDTKAVIRFDFEGGSGTINLDYEFDGQRKDLSITIEDGKRITRDYLDGFRDGLKSSLFHEYEGAYNHFFRQVSGSEPKEHGEKGLAALGLVKETYAVAQNNC